ncbi:MAG: fumarate hydratase [Peptococcaceae bacterium]|nr:fumarate hydratase [Peptococcaceae bacterium]
MKTISTDKIISEVAKLCADSNYYLGKDVVEALEKGRKKEISPVGINIFDQIIENAGIAAKNHVPICQDTGVAVVFLELGQDLKIEGGDLYEAINQGVRRGYQEGYLRKSIVNHPFLRVNTGDNTPAVIHLKMVAGENLKIIVAPKGGGSENMSAIKMLKPSAGIEGVKEFVIETIVNAGADPCPPIIVGIGIGGNFEKCALLAKEALLREVGKPNIIPDIALLEKDLLNNINSLGIGPQGLGGIVTALGVNIEIFPCHIASLPVAVNINCHAARHKEIIL